MFGLLNTKAVQNYAKGIVVQELKHKLDTELGVGSLYFMPFNTIGLDSLYVLDKESNDILVVNNLSASVNLFELFKNKIVITSAHLTDFDVHLSKASSDSTLNIQFIIDAFKSKDEKPKSKIDFQINAINVAKGNFYYNILDKTPKNNRFDENHLAINDLNIRLALKSLKGDSLNVQIRKLNFKEKSGFEVSNLKGRLITKDNHASIKGFELLLPNSRIELGKLDVTLPITRQDSIQAHDHEVDDLKFDFVLSNSEITPRDIAAFVPELRHFEDKVTIRSEISGTEHKINMKNLTLRFGNKLRLNANAELIDWNSDEDAYILANIDELTSSGIEIERLANSFSTKKIILPQGILNQENISFQGDLSGYTSHLTAFGNLDTDNGSIITDLVLGFNKKEKIFSYTKGKIYTTDFELGKFIANNALGNISFSIALDFNKPFRKEAKGSVKGEVYNFDFKDYRYSDIALDVDYTRNRVDGALRVNDDNGSINLNGTLDLSDKKLPLLDIKGKVVNIQLANLNLVKSLEYSYLSLNIDANFVGSNVDNVKGYLSIDSLEFYRNQDEFKLDKLLVSASGKSTTLDRKIEIQSDLVNGYIVGESSLMSIGNSLKTTFSAYLPALFGEKLKPVTLSNNFKFNFDIANTESVSAILNLPFTIYQPANIKGFYENSADFFKLEVTTPSIKAGGAKIYSGYVLAENSSNNLSATIKADVESKNQVINNIVIKATAQANKIETLLDFENNSKSKDKGKFRLLTEFEKPSIKSDLTTKIKIEESNILLNNTNWKLEKSDITIDKRLIKVEDFKLHSEDNKQELIIDGSYSKYTSDLLKVRLRKIDLAYIFETLAINALKFGGAASGDIFLSSVEGKPYVNTKLEVDNFKFHGTEFGHLNLYSELNEKTNEIILNGLIVNKEKKKTTVNGMIDPINQNLSIHFDADDIDISFLHAYSESIFDKVSGRGTGQVHLYGDFSNVTVEGIANITDGNFGIKFLNTNYTFSDVIYLRKGFIYFNDIQFKDRLGNIAVGSGKVVHNYFQDIVYHIELAADNFLLYNATEAMNPLFFGQVYGSGKGIIAGDEGEVNIDINMKTQPNTQVRMNLMENAINEYSFITYKEPASEKNETSKSGQLSPIQVNKEMGINMNFYIDATPDATVEMVMDPVGGDVLKGSGEGALQFVWSSKLPPQLFGTFNVNRGSYNFTFQKIMERKFSIQDGSTIQFRGDPFEAILDVDAVYKVSASLSDLDRELVKQSGQVSIPVHCILNLTGPLKQPTVSLDIDFPSTNPDVARQIKNMMDTEDMINKQVAYLLLLSKFHTTDMGDVDNPSSDLAIVASATLSSQLSNIISRIDSRWQLGTHIRMSDADMKSKEVELLLSSQLLNNRLLINGNFGYRDDPYINNNAVITDVDIEYLLNASGTWRVKAYNHYNEKFYYLRDEGLQTQGIGIIYRKDFDKISELFPFRRRNIKPVTEYDIRIPVLPDSIQKGSELSNFIKIKK